LRSLQMSEIPKKNEGASATPGRVRTSSRKRKSVDPISPVPTYMGKREEIHSHISTWNDESLDKLTAYLQQNGFDHDFLSLQKEFPTFSHHSLRAFFNELSRWSSDAAVNPLEDEVEAKKTQMPRREQKYSPNEEWINTIRDHLESQRLGPNLAHVFKFISLFEDHPDPDTVLGVDYKSIYMYISALMEGHIPKKLNAASATKMLEMFEKLVEYIKMNSERAKISLLQSANIPFINNRIDKESKNQFLRERRRSEWNDTEKHEAHLLASENLREIERVCCCKLGLNPFSFHPDMLDP